MVDLFGADKLFVDMNSLFLMVLFLCSKWILLVGCSDFICSEKFKFERSIQRIGKTSDLMPRTEQLNINQRVYILSKNVLMMFCTLNSAKLTSRKQYLRILLTSLREIYWRIIALISELLLTDHGFSNNTHRVLLFNYSFIAHSLSK